jgi:hypothetical protein
MLTRESTLSLSLRLGDGRMITAIGEAADFLTSLPDEKRQQSHWRIAIRMLDHAVREPAYLKAATMSLQTALAMDGLLGEMQV